MSYFNHQYSTTYKQLSFIVVGNRFRIHRNPRQFTWCSFIRNNESQRHSFRNSHTHRYFRYDKLVLIAWSSPFDSPHLVLFPWYPFIISVITAHFVTVPWIYRRSWANYLAINVAINLKYNKAKRRRMYYEICTHTIGAQFPTHPLWSGHLGRSRRCPLNRGFTVLDKFQLQVSLRGNIARILLF